MCQDIGGSFYRSRRYNLDLEIVEDYRLARQPDSIREIGFTQMTPFVRCYFRYTPIGDPYQTFTAPAGAAAWSRYVNTGACRRLSYRTTGFNRCFPAGRRKPDPN